MAKNKKKSGTQNRAPSGGQPAPTRKVTPPPANRKSVSPMVIIGIPALILLISVGGLAYQALRKPTQEPAAPSTTTATAPRPQPEAGKPTSPNKRPPPPVRGLMAKLPADATPQFGDDQALAGEYNQLREALVTGEKTPMKVRQELEPLLGRAANNPGREQVLITLAYTDLKTRDGEAATGHLETLLRDFPKSDYAPIARGMQLEAAALKASPKEKGAQPDAAALQDVIRKGEALIKQETVPEAQAYAQFAVGTAYDLMDQHENTVKAYLELVEKYPDTPQAASSLVRAARAQQDMGQAEAALATLERLVKDYPTDEPTKEGQKMLRELRIIGKPAPELKVLTWPSGGETTIEAQKGKVVLLVFWQTWCPHCMKELPELAELYEQKKDDGLMIIGVTRDDNRQTEQQLTDFLASHPQPFPIARIDPQSSRDYAVSGYPSAALIDRDGIVRGRSHPNQLKAKLETLLASR